MRNEITLAKVRAYDVEVGDVLRTFKAGAWHRVIDIGYSAGGVEREDERLNEALRQLRDAPCGPYVVLLLQGAPEVTIQGGQVRLSGSESPSWPTMRKRFVKALHDHDLVEIQVARELVEDRP
jgi:hypothetical protein